MSTDGKNTFRKKEHLCKQTLIEKLFGGDAKATTAWPIRMVWLLVDKKDESEASLQVLVSVSKRFFKRAVKRNRVKRQIREMFRHHKQANCWFLPRLSLRWKNFSTHWRTTWRRSSGKNLLKQLTAYEEVFADVGARDREDARMGIGSSDIVLSEVHHSLYTSLVSLSAHLLRICETSHIEAWSFQGTCFGYMAHLEMQSLGRFGLRPRAVSSDSVSGPIYIHSYNI